MTGRVAMMLCGFAVAALLGGCGQSDPASSAKLVRTRCTRCHDTKRIRASAAKDRAYWETTVDRMRGRGARIHDAERDTVVEFLSAGGAADL